MRRLEGHSRSSDAVLFLFQTTNLLHLLPKNRDRDGDRSKRRGDNDDGFEGRRRHEKGPEAMHQDEQDNAPPAADDDDDPEAQMMKLMGFGGFETTKGKHVAGADMSGANVKKQPKYRQYMNRRGGFNRPLDKV